MSKPALSSRHNDTDRQADAAEDDARLIAAVAAGDRHAFETLYRRFAPRLGAYLWRMIGRHELVDEALNDTMMVLWRTAERFDGRASAVSWLLGIAHNHALKALSRQRRGSANHLSTDPDGEDSGAQLAGDDDPQRDTAQRDLRRALRTALDSLSSDHRAVIELTFYEGLSCAEIAAVLDCPINTVKTRMFHARKRLRVGASALGIDRATELEDDPA